MTDHFLLVTISDEKTWGHKEKLLFLGDWCLPYPKENNLKGIDYVKAMPYGTELSIKDRDYQITKEIVETALDLLILKLNQIHKKKYGKRQWRIILGHWLRRYAEVCINRFNSIEDCLKKYKVKSTIILQNSELSLISETSLQFVHACNQDFWNSLFYGKVFEYLNRYGFDIKLAYVGFENKSSIAKPLAEVNLKSKLKNVFYFLNGILKNKGEYFLYNAYLPKLDHIYLSIKLKQWPKFYRILEYNKTEINRELRKSLKIKLLDKNKPDVREFALEHMFEVLPKCYLEDFESIERAVVKSGWPKEPKVLLTANAFDYDEPFKIYAASKTFDRIKYLVLQHGNNYGTYRFNLPTIEELTSDKFLTWGWKEDLDQQIPGFVIKKKPENAKSVNSSQLLLIEYPLYHKIVTWDVYAEFSNYFEEQKQFVSSLKKEIKDSLSVRLHPDYKIRDWGEISRWKDFDKNIKFDDLNQSVNDSIRRSKLVIFSYDSTGILENLSANVPMMAFWQNNYDHLRDTAIPDYEELRKVGIIHLSVESIINQIHGVWQNIDSWWKQEELQKVRIDFCQKYARSENKKIRKVVEFIRD